MVGSINYGQFRPIECLVAASPWNQRGWRHDAAFTKDSPIVLPGHYRWPTHWASFSVLVSEPVLAWSVHMRAMGFR